MTTTQGMMLVKIHQTYKR